MGKEATADLLPQAEQAALENLLRQINEYKDTTAGRIFGKLANKVATEPGNLVPMADKLIVDGLLLLHSSLHAQDQRFSFRQIGDTYLLDLQANAGIVDESFVEKLDTAVKESDNVIARRGKKAVQTVSTIYPLWANKVFGMDPDEEFRHVAFDTTPIVTVWDHHLPERKMFGDIWGVPQKTHSPLYNYLKGRGFPPSYFLSNEYANSFKMYVEGVAEELGVPVLTILELSSAHEKFHQVGTIPINDLIIPQSDNWWSEAVAITYTDLPNYQRRNNQQVNKEEDSSAEQIMRAASGVKYKDSLSLWLALSSMEAGAYDLDKIYTGSDGLVGKMVELAEKGNTIQPWEIPGKLFPRIEERSVLAEANARRPIMLGMLQQGAFAVR
jgi:hypothetical protein